VLRRRAAGSGVVLTLQRLRRGRQEEATFELQVTSMMQVRARLESCSFPHPLERTRGPVGDRVQFASQQARSRWPAFIGATLTRLRVPGGAARVGRPAGCCRRIRGCARALLSS
jgi:hypothetical protein